MEYKFRAFIPDLNIMLYNVDVYANGMIGVELGKLNLPKEYNFDNASIYKWNDNEECYSDWVMSVLEGEEYILFEQGQYKLMQYTGLKDKNGVEIYSGDYLVLNNECVVIVLYNIQTACYEVEYDSGERESLYAVIDREAECSVNKPTPTF